MDWRSQNPPTTAAFIPLLLLFNFLSLAYIAASGEPPERQSSTRRDLSAVAPPQPNPLNLPYHNGPILSGKNGITDLYLIFYGNFTSYQRERVRRFLRSLTPPVRRPRASIPTVAKWWAITNGYKDVYGDPVAQLFQTSGEIQDRFYSLGWNLTKTDIEALVLNSLAAFDANARSLYLVLTSSGVQIEGFCSQFCGQHSYLYPSELTGGQMLPYAWVGDATHQCPGTCFWPFTNATLGTAGVPFVPSSGDLGADGIILNLASLLAAAATNPYQNAYYSGDATAPLEAAEACAPGLFGPGAFAGFPGGLLQDNATGVNFNVYGFHRNPFLVPWMWNPMTSMCSGQA